ncbi:MAG: DUF4870 domain-containing protein [Candidatus Nanoarchaeia archaeon]
MATKSVKTSKTALGLDENVEGLLCYVLIFITGIVFLILEKDNKFVKFHALQSLLTFAGLFVVTMVLFMIPILGWLVGMLLEILGFVLWIVLMVKAFQGEKFKLPVIGDFVEKQVYK